MPLLLGSVLAAFAAPPQGSNCDINHDGSTNSQDIIAILNEALGVTSASHDLNGDGVVNVLDVQIVINAAAGLGCSADTSTPPVITDFTPKSGPIGTTVTVTGSNFGSTLAVTMPKQGSGTVAEPLSNLSPSSVSFAIAPGTASGPITLANGGASTATSTSFTVTPSSNFTLSASPGTANLIQGQSVTYSVQLNSTNGFTQLAGLNVTGTPTGVNASFKPSSITAGQNSLLTLTAPGNQPVATSNLSLRASATVDGIAVTQSTPLTLNVTAPTTSFVGRTVVSDTVETPLAGVTISTMGLDGSGNTTGCTGHTVVSDASGNFALTNLPSSCIGPQLIRFDGTTATSPPGKYAGVDLVFTLVSGQVVVSPVLVHMPRVDNSETFMVQQNSNVDQSYTFTTIPGLSVTVYAGTVLTNFDGTQPNPFPLTAIQVPVDRLPDQMPLTNSMVTAFIVAFQPANTTASKAVAVWFPNTLNTPPGTDVPLMTLDPTRGRMVAYGTGTVSNDGTTIIPDIDPSTGSLQHRFGIVHFDWHGPAGGPPNENDPPPDPGCPCSGDPVNLASGVEVLTSTDLAYVGSRGSMAITRTYRTLAVQGTIPGPFGWGSYHNFEYRLDSLTPQNAAVVNLILPTGARIPFTRQNNGTLINTTVPMVAGWVMTPNADGSTTVTQRGGLSFQFVPGIPPTGSVLVGIADPNGNRITIVRPAGTPYQISEIDDAVGRKLTFQYNGYVITGITDPIGRSVSYTYNNAGYLATFTNVNGGVTSYQYDSQNRITQITNPHGAVTRMTYDSNGRVASQTAPNGGTTTYAYTIANTLVPNSPVTQTVVTDPLGNATTYRFNTQGFLVAATDPTGQVRNITRQPGTNQIVALTGAGTCPACGNPKEGDTTFTYDASGNMLTRADALGNTWTFAYDPVFNNLISVTDPLGKITRRIYDAYGNLIKITDARGNSVNFTRDGTGLVTSAQDAAGNITKMSYDSLGNLLSVTNPLSQKMQFSYDGVSRLLAQMDPLGRTVSAAYNAANQITSMQDGNGHGAQFAYDSAGFLTSVTDANGGKTAITYDSAGRILSRTDPLHRATSYQYDADDNILNFTNRRGQQATYTYDALNRVIAETYVDATVQRSYDSAGRLIQVVDSQAGTFNLTYDLVGRVVKQVGPNGVITYAYDADGRLTSRQVQGQPAATYTYDANGNVTNSAMGATTVSRTYDVRNLPTANVRSNGVTGSYGFDTTGRLLSISEQSGGHAVFSRAFNYDAAGQMTSNSLDTGLPLSTPSAAGAVDAANELTSFGGTTYTSDADGNRLTETSPAGTTTYTWDSRGRLQSIVTPGGVTDSFIYDPGGNMIQKHISGNGQNVTERYILDDISNVVSVQQGDGSITSILDGRISDDIIATIQGGSPVFPLLDQVSSEGAFTDATGNVVGREFYEPFGAATASGAVGFLLFTGRPQINANLYYDRSRFYDSATGRFLSEDPAAIGGGDTDYYRYVFNNPAQFVDPLGLDAWTSFMGVVRAAGGVAETAAGIGLGAATSWTGIGAVAGGAVALHGIDQVVAGLRQAFSGCQTDSGTSTLLQKAGVSQGWANGIDAGISVVGSMGAGTATQAIRAGGLGNVGYYEIGQKTLNAADWGKYGQIADPVQRGMQIVADQGWAGAIMPNAGQYGRTIGTGLTPLATGALGAAGGAGTLAGGDCCR